MSNPEKTEWSPFSATQWIAWLGATLIAAVTVVAYAYQNFETKDEARDHTGNVMQRLDRMESKQDRMESKIDEIRDRRGH